MTYYTILFHDDRECECEIVINDDNFKITYSFYDLDGTLVENKWFTTNSDTQEQKRETIQRGLEYVNEWYKY